MSLSGKPQILAVEDNSETQLLLRHLLGEDYDLTIASGVDGALQAAEEEAAKEGLFDAFLLDINLGEERSGTDLLRLLREREQTYVPAIALTAYAMPGDEEYFLSEGFDQYLAKPFTRKDLTCALKQTLASA